MPRDSFEFARDCGLDGVAVHGVPAIIAIGKRLWITLEFRHTLKRASEGVFRGNDGSTLVQDLLLSGFDASYQPLGDVGPIIHVMHLAAPEKPPYRETVAKLCSMVKMARREGQGDEVWKSL